MLTETITLHQPSGKITWLHVRRQIDVSEKYINTFPWDWTAPGDREKVKNAFARALLGQPAGAVRYQLDPMLYPGGGWTVETDWQRVPSNDLPVLGISRTFNSVVENLSPRERDIARLLPEFSVKEIAKKLEISASTVDTFRARLGTKLNLTGGQLITWCAAHADIL